jgi:high-affinity iron transporter
MFSSGLITFRETLEAALVVGIVLTFLTKTNQQIFKKYVWQGIFGGVILSLVAALALETFIGEFEGRTEEIFEGVLMFITVGFLSWMIMWVHKQKDIAKKIKEKVALHAKEGYGFGIFVLVLSSVFREGMETVLYLKASSLTGATNQLVGALLGIGAALGLGYALFKWAVKVNLKLVFNITSIFLLLFAAGLSAHGVHEFQEAGLLPIFSFDPIFNISHILDNSSTLGGLLRTVFGYTSKPTFLELASYGGYIGIIVWIQRYASKMLSKNI